MHDENLIELETLYRTAPVGLCLVDRDLRYVRINERLAAINGKPPGEHIGRTIREIIPEVASQIEPVYQRVFESGEPILDVETSGTLPAEPEVERCWRSSYYPMKSPDGTVERVSTVVEDITAPRRAKQLLEERLQFETLLSDLSTTFINLPDSALGQEIERGLERIIETLNIDRVSLLEFSEDKTRLMIAHIYEHPGAPPFPGFVASNRFPWITEKIRRGEMLVLSRCPDDLPEEAKPERQYCRQWGLKSHLTLPLTVGGSILGAMAFSSYRRYVTWSEDLIQRLRIAGEVFANALVRKRAEEVLKTERQRLFTLLDELPASVSLKAPDYSVRYVNHLCREVFGNPRGKRCYELVGREAPCDECPQFRVLETGELHNFEWTWPELGRTFQIYSYPFADVDGSPLVLSLGIDITERKQAEEELRVSEARYRGLFNNMSSGVAVYEASDSGRDFIFKDFNQAAECICRMEKEDLIGKSVQKVFPGIKEFGLLEVFHRVWETGNPEHYPVSFYRDQRFSGWLANYVLKLPTGEIVAIFDDVTERQQAEEALRQSEARLAETQRIAHLGSWEWLIPEDKAFWSLETFHIYHQVPQPFGPSYEEFLSLVHPEDKNSVRKSLEDALGGGRHNIDFRILLSDGTMRFLHGEAEVSFDEAGKPVRMLGMVQDITERQQAEEALRESEETLREHLYFLQTLIDTIPSPIFYKNVQGIYLGCNQATSDFLGLAKEEIVGKTVHDVFPKDLADKYSEMDAALFRQPGVQIYDFSMLHVDGTRHDVNFHRATYSTTDGTLAGLVAVMIDITERKRAEEALRESEEHYRSLVENIDLGITLIGSDYRIIMTNAATGRMFQKPVSEFVGKECFKEFEKRDRVCPHCPGTRAMATGRPAETETEGGRDDGSRFPVRISAFPIFSPKGQVAGFIEVVEDITQRRRAEEALQASQEALRKSKESYQSLAGQLLTAQEAERRRLARELHDDLSQRLAALALEAARLEHQPQSSQGAVSAGLKEMRDKLVELSIDTHEISRRLHPSILDDLGLADAVQSECASFAQREGIVVNYKSESVPREVPQDVALCIYRTVQEGLRNISRHARATKAEILLIGKGDTIHLLIKDNGIGFNPLQVKKKGGLGLASMKERVYLVRGDFSIQSQPGQGTVIEALVPLSRSPLHETHPDIAGR